MDKARKELEQWLTIFQVTDLWKEKNTDLLMAWHTRHSQPKVKRDEILCCLQNGNYAYPGSHLGEIADALFSLFNGEREKGQSVRSEIDQKFVQFETHLRGGSQHYAQFYPDCEACHPRPADA